MDPATQEALGVLRSQQFNEKFILDENLLPQLFASKWDAAHNAWKPDVKSVPTVGRAFKYFNKSIRTITVDNKTGLITLQVDWKNRIAAAAWANELVKRVNAEMRRRAILNADASVTFLEKELATTSVIETREAINRLIETQEKQRMLANVTEEFAFRVVDPAIAPDADDPVKPPKLVLIIAGPLVGLILSVACILLFTPAVSRNALTGERASIG
jgi:capsular polysaccharide biosynthesis protein